MSDPRAPTEPGAGGEPDFGPRGYLPGRAAKRARKIVLRAPMGAQWIVGAVVTGLVLLVAGGLLLTRGGGPPGDPYVEVGPVSEVAGTVTYDDDLEVLLVGVGGRVRAFDAPADVRYREGSGRLESSDGARWSLTGRGLDGTAALPEHPTVASDGQLYLDPTTTATRPASTP